MERTALVCSLDISVVSTIMDRTLETASKELLSYSVQYFLYPVIQNGGSIIELDG